MPPSSIAQRGTFLRDTPSLGASQLLLFVRQIRGEGLALHMEPRRCGGLVPSVEVPILRILHPRFRLVPVEPIVVLDTSCTALCELFTSAVHGVRVRRTHAGIPDLETIETRAPGRHEPKKDHDDRHQAMTHDVSLATVA